MKFNIFKKAFSLTELLIVLVVVAVLFAAMIPMATKRNRGQTSANEPVWMFVKDDPEKSAFYDPGSSAITSAAYIGFKPETSELSSLKPFSKVVVRAKEFQNHIQFRTGNDGNGTLAGLFVATPKNMILGSRLRGDKDDNYNTLLENNANWATVLGTNAAAQVVNAYNGTAVGSSAGMGSAEGTSHTLGQSVSVGNQSNLYGLGVKSTLIGANTGKTESISRQIQETVAVGAGNLGLPTSSGQRNVLMGYGVGAVGFDSTNAMDNVILNSAYPGTLPKSSTIVGYQSFLPGYQDAKSVTAIGYYACSSFNKGMDSKGSNGLTTCIGYNSAGRTGYAGETKNLGWESDSYDHIFIGGKPEGAFPGRAVLEIHNIPTTNSNLAYPLNVGPTVVMNSHLAVRGNFYFPDSTTGQVATYNKQQTFYTVDPDDSEKGKDRCGYKCVGRWLGGRKDWRDQPRCQWLKIIGGILGSLAGIAAFILTGGLAGPVILAVVGQVMYVGGAVLATDAIFSMDDYDRTPDPASKSPLLIQYDESTATKPAFNCSTNYAPYFTEKYCPNVLRTSDVRLKDNISENSDALSKLLLLEPYNYTYKADSDKTPQVGVMAQDLEKVFPNAVAEDSKGYKNIRLDEIFYVVINSVKSLDSSVSTIDKDLKTLEADVVDVDKDHRTISKRINEINKRITKLENE